MKPLTESKSLGNIKPQGASMRPTGPPPAPKTDVERQRARTERLAREGLKPVRVIVPVSREAEIKRIAEWMRREGGRHD